MRFAPDASRASVLLAISALAMFALVSAAQSPRPSKPQSAIQRAIAHLIEEAQFAIREGTLHHEQADYAARFPSEIPLRDLTEAIAAPVDREPFIDAYVRWQLTSFNPSLPDLNDQQFLALLSNAPAFVDNPRAQTEIVAHFEQAKQSAKLSSRELDELRAVKEVLDRRVKLAESFNRSAEGYRDWLAKQFEKSRVRQHCLLVERCSATIKAGWPPRAVKAKLTKSMKQAGDDSSITPHQRELIAHQLEQLAKIDKRRAVNEITFTGKGEVKVTFSNIDADQDDVDKWVAQLRGNSP